MAGAWMLTAAGASAQATATDDSSTSIQPDALERLKQRVLPIIHERVTHRNASSVRGTALLSLYIAVEIEDFVLTSARISRDGKQVVRRDYAVHEARALRDGGWHRVYHTRIAQHPHTFTAELQGHVIGDDRARTTPTQPTTLRVRLNPVAPHEATSRIAVVFPVVGQRADATEEPLAPDSSDPVASASRVIRYAGADIEAPYTIADHPDIRHARFHLRAGRPLPAYIALQDALDAGIAATHAALALPLARTYAVLGMPATATATLDRMECESVGVEDIRDTRDLRMQLATDALARGRPDNAARHLQILSPPASDHDAAALNALRGRIALAHGQPEAAAQHFAAIAPAMRSIYDEYNRAIAMLRADAPDAGISILESARTLPLRNDAELAMLDRAHLLLGQLHLAAGNSVGARRALERVRLNGPYANKALLAIGWVMLSGAPPANEKVWHRLLRWLSDAFHDPSDSNKALRTPDIERALQRWEALFDGELSDPVDPVVQEALLASAYLLDHLGRQQHARERYESAIKALESAMTLVEKEIKGFGRPFLDTLIHTGSMDQFGNAWEPGGLPDVQATYWLPRLLASNRFQTTLRDYRDLSILLQMMRATRDQAISTRTHEQRLHRIEKLQQTQTDTLQTIAMHAMQHRREQLEQHLVRARFALARMVEGHGRASRQTDDPDSGADD